ncbi:MAG: hypothetical protein A2Z86_04290 [Candidatus Glassbacteria bacterium GWA2_58_10]|uniref:DUF3857 domain-containing protein n=1 Tax=Candidatus Glassbacteria bacterium GWA2_58_10 TaxID=1817865 RepID=A0A1F5YDP5_9BACT|nr:MAG: hypothetical protein A2Z86_04290 [Candidatus Glassbacteria bacterium GWA2_58_10]
MTLGKLSIPLWLLFLALPLLGQDDQVPDDYDGLLVRDDFTATMRGGDLEVTVTAMDDRIINYATKEMRDHLRKMKENLLADNMYYSPNDKNRAVPFLVNFRALGQEVRYEPQELVIYNYGQEYKPLEIVPVSPNFNDRVTYIRKPPVSAIYLFDRNIDLNSRELSIVYYNSLAFNNWLRVIEKLHEAKAQYEVYKARNSGK